MANANPFSPLVPAPHPAGLYRISFYIHTTVASAGASMLINITYNDGTARSFQVVNHDLSNINAVTTGTLLGYSDGSQPIGFTVSFTNRGTSQFLAWAVVEAL